MRVAMYYSNSDIRIEEMPEPEIGPGELLIRVEASGICGSDVMEWYRIDRVPLVLGHEISGEIVSVGKGVKGFKAGDRVSASHHVPCNRCRYCLSGHHTVCETLRKTKFYPGGFSEYIRLPAINVDRGVYKLPDNVSYEEATFIEPLACVLRGQRLAGMAEGKSVLILGSGISGLLHILMARSLKAGRIIATDISGHRLKWAKRLGADYVMDAGEDVCLRMAELNDNRLADIVILCTGAKGAISQALKSIDRGGTLLFFAAAEKEAVITLPVNEVFWRSEVRLISSYAGSPADHTEALGLISSQRVDVRQMITHRLPLSETRLGFQMVAGAGDSVKVIINPQR